MYDVIDYINKWQMTNDSEFKVIPTDNHFAMIFNLGNQEYKFIFSSKAKQRECQMSIPNELLTDFIYLIEQEEGLTFYNKAGKAPLL